ncbi:hypothetical protein [Pararhizobium arenae]|uniref:hypothetical protein n=1 Tax=Pararhizobium arenae TaxID=1856850 RepID=UPI00094AD71E|nr:hypothetical protein [Pararhizobium arenae]
MTRWTAEERRARWEHSVSKKQTAGFQVERDPQFLAWIEEWIAGDITMSEVQQRYAGLIRTHRTLHNAKQLGEGKDMQAIFDDIRQAVPEIPGLPLTTLEERALLAKQITELWATDES